MSKVTEKNTKKEIMDYVKELEAKLAEKSDARKTTDDIKKEAKVKEIKESAQKLIATGIVNEKTEAQYNDLLDTIKLLDEELKEVYEIQRNVHTLEALIITYQDKNESLLKEFNDKSIELQNEFEAKKAKWDADLKQCQADHDKLVKDLKAAYAEEKSKLDKDRAREKEEYTYNLNRERAIENDKWEDEKAAREKELADKEAFVATKLTEANEAIEKMEKLGELVKELEEKAKVAYSEGLAEGKKAAATSHAIETSHLKKENEWKVQKLEDEKKALAEALELERKAHADTKAKLDAAYAQVTNTAMAVAKSGVKVTMDSNK